MNSLYNLFSAKGQMFAFLLGVALVAIILISAITGLGSAGYDVGTDLNQILKSPGNTETFDFFNLVVALPRILVILAIALIFIFGIMQLVKNPKGSLKVLAGFGVVAILFFVFYSMAVPETGDSRLAMLHGKFDITETASKLISGGIKTVLTLGIGAILLMVVSEVLNLFK